MESTSIWQSITYELRGILHVALGYDDTLCSLSVLRTDTLTSRQSDFDGPMSMRSQNTQ